MKRLCSGVDRVNICVLYRIGDRVYNHVRDRVTDLVWARVMDLVRDRVDRVQR